MSAAEERFRQGGTPPPPPVLNAKAQAAGLDINALLHGAEEAAGETRPKNKKARILALYDEGVSKVAEIVMRLKVRPSYVGEVLRKERGIRYFDLFTSRSEPGTEQNAYASFFRGVVSFKTVAAAEESVTRLDRLFAYFGRLHDRAGQHEAQVVALTALNRARAQKKFREAEIFYRWLWVESLPSS